MKKLTLEKYATAKQHIWDAQVAGERKRQENPVTVTPRWRELMAIIWAAEEYLEKELGMSRSRAASLIAGETHIMDYYDHDTWKPLKGVRS